MTDRASKVCPGCRRELPHTQFHKNSRNRDGLQSRCRSCRADDDRVSRDRHPQRLPIWRRQNRYGLSDEQYRMMLEACGGRCEVCGDPPSLPFRVLDIDHDHATGRVRGLLCRPCNNALRRDDPKLLRALADYLERPHQNLEWYEEADAAWSAELERDAGSTT